MEKTPSQPFDPSLDIATRTVVVVESDEATRDSIAALLQGRGYAVETHATTTALLGALKGLVGACLVLDGVVDGASCFEILDSLRQRDVNLPTVLFSGLPESTLAPRLPAYTEVIAVLRKPLGGEALVSAVRKALASI